MCYLEENHEVLLKADSVADFKNMFQGTYKATQLTLTETVLLSFLSPTLKMVLSTFRSNHLSGFMEKQLYHKAFGIFQVKKWHSFFIAKQLQQYSVCRKNMKLFEERLHQKSYSSSQIHKSMSRYHNKDIKILVALLPTLKLFLSVEINSEVIEGAPRHCFF